MNSVIIIPTLNPNLKIIDLVKELKEKGFDKLIVVNDGSDEAHNNIFEQLKKLDCKVVVHSENKGKGQAIKTGITYAEECFKEFIGYITVDGDYQHLPKDVKQVALKMEEDDTKIVLGERELKGDNIPIKSRIGNGFSTIFFKLQTGAYIEDTQTGLRGIPYRYKNLALKVEGSRYEYEMNFLREAAQKKIQFELVRIDTVYEDNNKGSHFRPLKDAYLIYKEPIKFAIIALLSALIDITLFAIFNAILKSMITSFTLATAVANITSRILSGTFNFSMNKIFAFKSGGNTQKQILQYLALFFVQMGVSTLLVSIASKLTEYTVISKIFIDTIIFFVNYFVEKRYIFNESKDMDNL